MGIKQISLKRKSRLYRSMYQLLFIGILGFSPDIYAVQDQNIGNYYEISAGALGQALSDFAIQAGIALSFDPSLTRDLKTIGLKGLYSVDRGFAELLNGTDLQLVNRANQTWTIQKKKSAPEKPIEVVDVGRLNVINVFGRSSGQAFTNTSEAEFVFQGNMDLPRSENDIQPYKIIDKESIANSGAGSIDELLQKVLLSNTSVSNLDGRGFMGNTSQLNLRGLGTSQTLVLINGRRGAGTGYRGTSESTDQQNLNNIPLAAIERIEILPTSASAIYGSGALGGVINVILRRDYIGTEVNLRYDNSFNSDTAIKTLNFVTGFMIDDSQTQILMSGQKSQTNELTAADRDFHLQYRRQIIKNNPDAIYGMNTVNGTAIYPPYGALVNIRTQDGSALLPQYSDASFAYLPKGYAGYAMDGFEPLKATLGQYNLDLFDGISAFSRSASLVAANQTEAFGLNLYQPITDQLEFFVEGSYDRSLLKMTRANYDRMNVVTLDADAANNPFGKTVLIAFPVRWEDAPQRYRYIEDKNKKLIVGFSYRPSDEWVISADYMWSTAHIDLAHPRLFNNDYINDYMSGKLDLLRDTTSFYTPVSDYWQISRTYTHQTIQDYTLRSFGTVTSWYAGKINLATGIEYRNIHSDGIPEYTDHPVHTRHKQNNRSVYAELKIPFISEEMNLTWAKALEMQLATRYEQVDIQSSNAGFSATAPTLGFRFVPNHHFILRGSYSEGFTSPTLSQFGSGSSGSESVNVIDPITGLLTTVLTYSGGNPNIKPEKTRSHNLGMVYTPDFIPELRWSLDYYKIRKNNGITSLTAQDILNYGNQFVDRIERSPQGELLMINTMPFNALNLETSGFDMGLSLYLDHILHGLGLVANYTHVQSYKQQNVFAERPVEYVNYPDIGPLKDRVSVMAYLNLNDQWMFGWNVQYYGSYKIPSSNTFAITAQGGDSVASQTYHDVYARYQLPKAATARYGSPELTIGIKNLFANYEVDMSENYISPYTDPRLRQYYLNLKLSF